jgi:hypothetical protein
MGTRHYHDLLIFSVHFSGFIMEMVHDGVMGASAVRGRRHVVAVPETSS